MSIEFPYEWGSGEYQVEMKGELSEADGRWFGLYVTAIDAGRTVWVGSLRFPGSSIQASGITWMEIYGPGGIGIQHLPEFTASVSPPLGDSRWTATGVFPRGWCSPEGSDVRIDGASEAVKFAIGPGVRRTSD